MQIINKNSLKEILSARFKDDLCLKLADLPQPKELKDIKKAALRIKQAIEKKEKIAIIGDYDVDGVVSTLILAEFFDFLQVKYSAKIPNRFKDGYGLNANIVKKFQDYDLIITVDNGINAKEAAELCLEKNIDLIITDHHTPAAELPPAFAIVNPKREDCSFPNAEICGANVAWYLVAAIKQEMKIDFDLSSLLDILSIAIISDMMELKDINRTILKTGLKKLNSSKRFCFQAIKEFFKKDKFTYEDISFLLAPLLNSSGRMQDAKLSYDFLRAKNLKEARLLLEDIVKLNNLRKEKERELFEEASLKVREEDKILVLWGENWHKGIIGIVASRITKKYGKPSIILSLDGELAKGSTRSIGNIDILDLIKSQAPLLESFGGHKSAAGLSLKAENLEKFRTGINQAFKEEDEEGIFSESLGELDLNDLDIELLDILEFFSPYGQKNPPPLFTCTKCEVKAIRFLGKENSHLKLLLKKDEFFLDCLYFNFKVLPKINDKVDITFTLSKNIFKNNVSILISIIAMEIH